MKKFWAKCLPIMLLLTLSSVAWSQSEIESVKNNLRKILPPAMQITAVELTAMDSVYIVKAGTQTLYVYNKDEFVMVGEVYDTDRRISWTQERKDQEREVALVELDAMSEDNMIIMGDPKGERYITVFTDTDCPWCQKFHKDIPALQAAGLKVRYMMWPRSGTESATYDEAVSIWCAKDQAAAMTAAKNRQTIDPLFCENPVKEHYALGHRLGVQGTPFVMLDDGKVLGGYVAPEKILAEAGLN